MLKLSSHPVRDATPGEVVLGQLNAHGVTWQDANEVLAQLPGDMGQHLVSVLETNPKHGVRQGRDDLALYLDCILTCQALRTLVEPY